MAQKIFTDSCIVSFDQKLVRVVNDSRSAENEILQLMLYREAFLPPGPSARQLYVPIMRKIEALDQRLADAHSQTFGDSDDAGSQGNSHDFGT